MTIPCKDCITLSICKAYVAQRVEHYRNYTNIEDEYNEETICHLLRKCKLLLQYLPCDLSINGGFITRRHKTKMDRVTWYHRLDKVFKFFGPKWPTIFKILQK